MRVLELFSGTHSVGKVCQELGWEVISLDLKGADINIIPYESYLKLGKYLDLLGNFVYSRFLTLYEQIKKHR